ncbi:MAG: cell division protein FtsQ/DivIB [Flavobacteriaceae bacterium]|nr:cell division protein FtsQ/DivIB [Mangrovimonas sp.]MCB0437770.1 cell division protein FtsQ/DivIB [Mangrovimonas sp.]MCB0470568.1 cell division protein FtsQ/DivIB [Flavobacteriaceae bacterium]HRV54560.1 cell division protein FtsQ/DivIB [Mangrovimonas sp.]
MKVKFRHIKLVLLLGFSVFLFAFSSMRNSQRKVHQPLIEFKGKNDPYITTQTVSKLLIQNQQTVTDKPKETLDLNRLETALNSNPMIRSAQVFMHVDGVLKVEIEQKEPIARVLTQESYYIDSQGQYMPLSTNHTARVPFVTGSVQKDKLTNVYAIANKVYNDEFLKKNVIEIHQNDDTSLWLKLRDCKFTVELGNVKQLDKKINNLKAFYQKALKDNLLNNYSKVNLRFDNQVVCTKT